MDLTVSAVRTMLSQGPWGQLGVLCLLVSQLKSIYRVVKQQVYGGCLHHTIGYPIFPFFVFV